jgi:hypothetical protein
MANLSGFPNNQATLIEPPFMFAALLLADLANDEYIGMPIGTAIVVTDMDASGKGTYAMKMTTQYNNAGDWIALGGTWVDAGLPLND